ncbi:MAG: fusaricidin synthetase, partial [Segetibacter sp.]|nr:fusaricidin synthetase [Segetibacter sp.]
VPVRNVIFGGEMLNPSKLEPWKQQYQSCKLVNMYGITETTVHVTYQEIGWQQIKGTASIIGRPIPTLSVYVLDRDMQLVPVGVAGEMYIGGGGVARGYLNKGDLTAQRFIENVFSQDDNARLYRTGDLARWLPNGALEYMGRIDEQVKIRGYRIELGEIESVLLKSGLVNQVAVVAKEDKLNNKQLVGYVVVGNGFDKQAVTAYLHHNLPDYMIPVVWVELESFPITDNGKLNKKALPEPDASTLLAYQYVAPETEVQIRLAQIWKQLLGVDKVGINDDFFELGGNSLLIMRLVTAIQQEFEIEVAIKDLFLIKNISDLSKYLEVQVTFNAEQRDLPEVEEFYI